MMRRITRLLGPEGVDQPALRHMLAAECNHGLEEQQRPSGRFSAEGQRHPIDHHLESPERENPDTPWPVDLARLRCRPAKPTDQRIHPFPVLHQRQSEASQLRRKVAEAIEEGIMVESLREYQGFPKNAAGFHPPPLSQQHPCLHGQQFHVRAAEARALHQLERALHECDVLGVPTRRDERPHLRRAPNDVESEIAYLFGDRHGRLRLAQRQVRIASNHPLPRLRDV
jgi:hypothetical protein